MRAMHGYLGMQSHQQRCTTCSHDMARACGQSLGGLARGVEAHHSENRRRSSQVIYVLGAGASANSLPCSMPLLGFKGRYALSVSQSVIVIRISSIQCHVNCNMHVGLALF